MQCRPRHAQPLNQQAQCSATGKTSAALLPNLHLGSPSAEYETSSSPGRPVAAPSLTATARQSAEHDLTTAADLLTPAVNDAAPQTASAGSPTAAVDQSALPAAAAEQPDSLDLTAAALPGRQTASLEAGAAVGAAASELTTCAEAHHAAGGTGGSEHAAAAMQSPAATACQALQRSPPVGQLTDAMAHLLLATPHPTPLLLASDEAGDDGSSASAALAAGDSLGSPLAAARHFSAGSRSGNGGHHGRLQAVVTPDTPAAAQEALQAPPSLAGSSDVGGHWEGSCGTDAASAPSAARGREAADWPQQHEAGSALDSAVRGREAADWPQQHHADDALDSARDHGGGLDEAMLADGAAAAAVSLSDEPAEVGGVFLPAPDRQAEQHPCLLIAAARETKPACISSDKAW